MFGRRANDAASWDQETQCLLGAELGPVIPKYQEKYIAFQSDYTEALRNIRGEAGLLLELSAAFIVTEGVVAGVFVESEALRGAAVLSILMFVWASFQAASRLYVVSDGVDIPTQKIPRRAAERRWNPAFPAGLFFFVIFVCLGVQDLLGTNTEFLCVLAIIAGTFLVISALLALLSRFDVPLPPEDAPPVPRKMIW